MPGNSFLQHYSSHRSSVGVTNKSDQREWWTQIQSVRFHVLSHRSLMNEELVIVLSCVAWPHVLH